MADWMRKADEMNGEYEPKNKFGKDDVLQVKAGGETKLKIKIFKSTIAWFVILYICIVALFFSSF